MDAEIIAGNTSNGKRAYLPAKLGNGDYHIFELELFHILSLLVKDYKKEMGIATVFNRDFGILYSEQLYGTPTLENAELSFSAL